MKVKAVAKRVGISAIKARIVADAVRGMNAQDAVGTLTYVSKGADLPVKKLIQSAISNAKSNYNLDGDNMIIAEIRVDKGPIAKLNVKRGIMLGKGGFARFDRKYCHITVVLDEKGESKKERVQVQKETKTAKVAEEQIEVKLEDSEKKVSKSKKTVSSKKVAKEMAK